MSKKILILTGGPINKLVDFEFAAKDFDLNVDLSSFSDLVFANKSSEAVFKLSINGRDLKEYDLIYIRMVGKRLEDASLVVNYAKENNIPLVDRVYEKSLFLPSTISKAVEMKKLISQGIPLPDSIYGSLAKIGKMAFNQLGVPFVLKSTSGRKARDTWLIDSENTYSELFPDLREREKTGTKFFGQKMVKASQRIRILVVGGKVLGAITRPTKWRKMVSDEVEGKKEAIDPVPQKYSDLAIKAANAAELDICGVDILAEDKSGDLYILEANAAPSWKMIKKDCGIEVEREILEYLENII